MLEISPWVPVFLSRRGRCYLQISKQNEDVKRPEPFVNAFVLLHYLLYEYLKEQVNLKIHPLVNIVHALLKNLESEILHIQTQTELYPLHQLKNIIALDLVLDLELCCQKYNLRVNIRIFNSFSSIIYSLMWIMLPVIYHCIYRK